MDELEISGKRYISSRRAAKEHKYHSDYIGQLVRGGKVAGQKVGRAWYIDAESLAEYLGKEAPPRSAAAAKPDLMVTVEEAILAQPEIEAVVEAAPEPEQDFALPFRKSGRQHIIAAIDSFPLKEKVEPVREAPQIKEEPFHEIVAEIVEEDADAVPQIFEIKNISGEETHIPVKISGVPEGEYKREPEDSFYKVSRKGLRYLPHGATPMQAPGMAPVKKIISAQMGQNNFIQKSRPRTAMRYAGAITLVLLAGILSLGAGALLSYYLHSITTVNQAGQTSSVLLSQ